LRAGALELLHEEEWASPPPKRESVVPPQAAEAADAGQAGAEAEAVPSSAPRT